MDITIISGNVGKDPEMRFTPQGQPVTSFSVAVNRQWTDGSGQQHKETKWYRVTTWNKQAENCNTYVKKGMKVVVQGRLACDPNTGGPKVWTRQDGTSGASFDLQASFVEFGPNVEGSEHTNAPQEVGEVPPEDDIPF